MRTYDPAMYRRIQEAWKGFGHEWNAVKLLAAERGFPLPPEGSKHDDRDDPEPSPRSIIWRALDWRRDETIGFVKRSRSWSEVVGLIFGSEMNLREDATLREKDDRWERRDEPSARQALQSMATIFDRIRDS